MSAESGSVFTATGSVSAESEFSVVSFGDCVVLSVHGIEEGRFDVIYWFAAVLVARLFRRRPEDRHHRGLAMY